MIFDQIKQHASADRGGQEIASVIAKAQELGLDGDAMHRGTLAMAMWLVDPNPGQFLVRVEGTKLEGGGFANVHCAEIVYDQYASTAGWGACWSADGHHGTASDFRKKFQALKPVNAGATAHMFFNVVADNLPAFLKEFGLPKVDPGLVRQLVSEIQPGKALTSELEAQMQADTPEWATLRHEPFMSMEFFYSLVMRPMSDEFFDIMLHATTGLAGKAMKAAVYMNRPDWITRMLDGGYPVSEALDVSANAIETLQLFAGMGIDVTKPVKNGMTPLHMTDLPQTCRFLVEQGSDLHLLDDHGKTPLHYQLEKHRGSSDTQLASILLDAGADPFYMPPNVKPDYLTPFQHALRHGDVCHVSLILERFAVDFGQRTLSGRTLGQLCGKSPEMKQLLNSAKTMASVQTAMEGQRKQPGAPRKNSALSAL